MTSELVEFLHRGDTVVVKQGTGDGFDQYVKLNGGNGSIWRAHNRNVRVVHAS